MVVIVKALAAVTVILLRDVMSTVTLLPSVSSNMNSKCCSGGQRQQDRYL